jgi:hypothetical protein
MLPLYFAAWTQNWQCVQLLLGGGPMPDQLRVEISLAKQKMAVIKDGVTVFTTHCSTGRQGFPTPPGQYVITDKDRDHRSTIYKCAMPYFMRLNCRDFGISLWVTSALFAVALAITFAIWYRSEGTLSIHSIVTFRREAFYWLAVLFTFALGTAAGDLAAERLNLGYWVSALIFAGMIGAVFVAHERFNLNAVAAFWIASR